MERPRLRSRKSPVLGQPVTPPQERVRKQSPGLSTNAGPLATAAWLLARGLFPHERNWSVEVELPAGLARASRLEIEIFAEEWGFAFHHEGRVSWIRVTDIPFVHGRDDHDLLRETTSLRHIGDVVKTIERRYGIEVDRAAAVIRTNVVDGEPAIRAWLATL